MKTSLCRCSNSRTRKLVNSRTSFAVIIPAAGKGKRFGGSIPKPFVELCGKPIIYLTIKRYLSVTGLSHIIVVIPRDLSRDCRKIVNALIRMDPRIRTVWGGATRRQSVGYGLRALIRQGNIPPVTLVHDAVRPLVSGKLIRAVVRGAVRHGAVLPLLPVTDTLKRRDDRGFVTGTVSREGLFQAQTPQGFRTRLLVEAHARAEAMDLAVTDDTQLVEVLGLGRVAGIPGDPRNVKITRPEDKDAARTLAGFH
ncbi:MAG: 2-C-methyl-D-erythritol 4-phosphate cytidylyltransferase [Planctomycetota bacterium]